MAEFSDINLSLQHHHLIINGAAPVPHAVVVSRRMAAAEATVDVDVDEAKCKMAAMTDSNRVK
jgi:hypothetical protein